MKPLTRTDHSVKNAYITTVSRMVAILMGFATRVVFTRTLSESYVGINGLFTDILNVLALSELGIETAITFALYRPIAQDNKEEQKSLMRLYSWYYRIVAAMVLVIGLLFLPFMDLLIKNEPDVDHLTLIFLLYLFNSVLSYLFIYKKTLMDAHQLLYVGLLYQTIFWVLQDILQIIVLITTKNFILFLLIFILCTLGSNICISRRAGKLYPYIREKKVKPLPREKKQEIFKNIKAMFLHKIGNVAVNSTDNLILSSFVGIRSTGIYSNYFLIIQSINQILNQMFHGIAASVGNLGVEKTPHRVKKVFEITVFISHWVYGFGAICLYELLNPFVILSFGENYLFPKEIVLILCINFFIVGMKDTTLVFRDSLGLFWYDRYISLICALINLLLSILLVIQFGTIGVFLGTLISMLLTTAWLEPFFFYKYYLKMPSTKYFLRYIGYIISIGAIWGITDYFCRRIEGGLILVLFLRFILCLVIPNIIMLAIYFPRAEFKFVWNKLSKVLKNLKR